MRHLATLFLVVSITGCSTVTNWIPSFWDPNQSHKIIDVRLDIEQIDCNRPHAEQVSKLLADITWFRLYSESAGWRHGDVLRITKPIYDTTDEWVKRLQSGDTSATYCKLKRGILQLQAKRAAEAILGRY